MREDKMSKPIRYDQLYRNRKKKTIEEVYDDLVLIDDYGTCAVYTAVDHLLGRTVCLGVLQSRYRTDQRVRQAFVEACRFQISVPTLPRLAKVFTLNEEEAYVEMERRDGISWQQWLQADPGTDRRLKIMQNILESIADLHKVGLYHGALTPRALIIENDEDVTLLNMRARQKWIAAGGDVLDHARGYLPAGWLRSETARENQEELGFLADVHSTMKICQELWRDGAARAPADLNRGIHEYFKDQACHPAANALRALEEFRDRFGRHLAEYEHYAQETARREQAVNQERVVTIRYIDHCLKNLHRQSVLDLAVGYLLTLGLLAACVWWISFWAERFSRNNAAGQWGMHCVGVFGTITLIWSLWAFLRYEAKRQAEFLLGRYFEPRISRGGCSWEEVMLIVRKYFYRPTPMLFGILNYKPRKLAHSERLKTLQKIRVRCLKLDLAHIRWNRFFAVIFVLYFAFLLLVNFAIEHDFGEGAGLLYRILMIPIAGLLFLLLFALRQRCLKGSATRGYRKISVIANEKVKQGYITHDEVRLETRHYVKSSSD